MDVSQPVSIMTVAGEKQPSDFQGYSYILPHEHLIQNLTRYFTGNPNSIEQIGLPNYSRIKENPYSNLMNLALNDVEEICTELKQAFGDAPVLIVESSSTESGRDMEKLRLISQRNKVDIISGFKPIIKGSLYEDEEKNKVFVNVDKFGKDIQEEIFSETKPKAGFIGELTVEENLFDKHQNVIFETCVLQAAKSNIPLYLECRRTKDLALLSKTIEYIFKVAAGAKIKLVLWNPDLVFSKDIVKNIDSKYPHVQTTFQNLDTIKEIISKGIIVGFDIYSYIDELYELGALIKILLAENLHDYILLSSGVKFKTHLQKYGGIGYGAIEKFIRVLREVQVSDAQIEQVMKNNVLSLMNWWRPLKIKEVYVKMWNCATCNKEYEESVPKFSKQGHDFCTPKCMRGFTYS